MFAYREMPDADLFSEQSGACPASPARNAGIQVTAYRLAPSAAKASAYDREVLIEADILCQGCASPETRYYQPLTEPEFAAQNDKASAEFTPQPAL